MNNSQLFWPSNLTCYQLPGTFFNFTWFTYLKSLTWYIHEQIPVPELHCANVLSQSTRVCKFLGVIDSATNSPANCHCVPNMSDYIPICLLCDPPGTVYTYIHMGPPLDYLASANVWPGKWAGYNLCIKSSFKHLTIHNYAQRFFFSWNIINFIPVPITVQLHCHAWR